MRPEQERVKTLLTEAITLLCRNSLQYKENISVEGLIGITLDEKDILLVNINETIKSSFLNESNSYDENNRNINKDESCKSKHSSQSFSHSISHKSPNPTTQNPPSTKHQESEIPAYFPLIQPKVEPNDLTDEINSKIKLEKVDTLEENEVSKTISSVSPCNLVNVSNVNRGNNSESFDLKSMKDQFNQNYSANNNSSVMETIDFKDESDDIDPYFIIDSDEEEYNDFSNEDDIPDNMPAYLKNKLPKMNRYSSEYEQSSINSSGLVGNSQYQDNEMNWSNFGTETENNGDSFSAGGENSLKNPNHIMPNQCPICFKKVAVVKNHMMSVHLNIKNHLCKICGKAFGAGITLSRHIVRIHTNIRAFKCPGCEHRCKVKWDLKVHVRTCIQCKSKGITLDDLESYFKSMKHTNSANDTGALL